MRKYTPILVILVVLLIDQISKLYIKSNWMLYQDYEVTSWFTLKFVENNGMAYGMELGGEWGKLALSLFRIVAITFIGIYLFKLNKDTSKPIGFIISIALVFSGALGNIIDSAFYGMIFTDSYHQVAQFMPEGGGYSSFLHGKVVDMLYFPLFEGRYPEWFPFWGNDPFIFFRPVFNIADSAITSGIALVLLFYRNIVLK
jgi:signal peptidase II